MGTILVTGASGGIGQAVCARLAQAGDRLILAARGLERLQTLASNLPPPAGQPHLCIPVDMRDDAAVADFSSRLRSEAVALDGVVLMPPQPSPTPEALPTNEVWRDLFQASFIGPLSLLKEAIGTMRTNPSAGHRAKIVVVSGISSVQVLGHYATGNVIRTAWIAEAKTLAFALAERGIHVNTLSLGGTLSEHYLGLIAKRAAAAGVTVEQRIAEETANIPLRKYGQPDEVAGMIEVLLSNVSDHMTGTNTCSMAASREPIERAGTMAEISIRTARPEDDLVLGELLVGAYSNQYARKFRDVVMPPSRAADLRDVAAKRANATVLVAERGSQIVGTVSIYLPGAAGSEAWLENAADIRYLAVDAALQGQGLSSGLLDEAERRASSAGVKAICLHVRRGAEGVARLYKSRGYVRDETGDLDLLPLVFLEAYALLLERKEEP